MPGHTNPPLPVPLILAVLLSASSCSTPQHHPAAIRTDNQLKIDLNGKWLVAFDPQNTGMGRGFITAPPVDVETLPVPSAWQSTQSGADYEGVAWYYTSFELPPEAADKRLTLHFERVNYHAIVWLNGTYIGEHEGGYLPFEFDITWPARIGKANNLVVRVLDTPRLSYADRLNLYEVAHGGEARYVNFGGICGNVSIRAYDKARITDLFLMPDPAASAIHIRCTANAPNARGPAILSATASGVQDESIEYGSVSTPVELSREATFEAVLPLRDVLWWSPEHPFLYRVNVRLVQGQTVLAARSETMGFRTFNVRDDHILLNGKRIQLRGVVILPFFPGTLSSPPTTQWCREQVLLIKKAGFNAVKFDPGPAPYEFLQEADRQGLLVIQQPPIGRPICTDPAALKTRLLYQVTGMVRQDRNHPCIVMWGLSETWHPEIPRLAPAMIQAIRQLDTSRPVLLQTENGKGKCMPAGSRSAVPTVSVRLDCASPIPQAVRNRLHRVLEVSGGRDGLLIADYGCGGAADTAQALKKYGMRHFLEDYRYFAGLHHLVRKSVGAWPLNTKFHSQEDFVRALQQAQASGIREQNDLIEQYADIDMLFLAQWHDCVRDCTAGIVGVWNEPKPAYMTCCELNRPLRLIVRPRHPSLRLGSQVQAEAWFVNGRRREGPAVLRIQMRDPAGERISAPEVHVQLSGRPVERFGSFELGLPKSEGRHIISARLVHLGQTIARAETTVLVVSREAASVASPVTLYDPGGALKRYFSVHETPCSDLADCDQTAAVIVAARLGSAPLKVAARLFAAVRDGAWAVLLDPPRPGEPLHVSGLLSPGVASAGPPRLGWYAYALRHPIFEGLPVDDLLGSEYCNVMPRYALVESETFRPDRSWEHVCGAVTGYSGFAGHCILVMPMGRGKIILSTLEILPNLCRDPVADRLLANMVRYAESASGRKDLQPIPSGMIASALAEYEQAFDAARSPRREILLVGPWPLKPAESEPDISGAGSTFDIVLPPENDLDPAATYTSWEDVDLHWRLTTISPYGRIRLLPQFTKPYVVGYAYAHVRSQQETSAELVVRSRMPIKVWLNGREKYLSRDPVARLEGYLPAAREVRSTVKLVRGLNQLLVKFGWAGEPSEIDVRFLRNGLPLPGLDFIAPERPDLDDR